MRSTKGGSLKHTVVVISIHADIRHECHVNFGLAVISLNCFFCLFFYVVHFF